MNEIIRDVEVTRRVLRDYRVVQKFLQSAVRFLAGEPEYATETVDSLSRDLMTLRRHMDVHFELEDREGFRELLVRLLTLDATLKALRGDPANLLDKVDGMIRFLREPHAENLRTIRRDLEVFSRALERHEKAHEGCV